MAKHQLEKPLNVYGAFTLEKGRLTFRTGDAALTQQLQRDRTAGRPSTVWLLKADPIQDFTGTLESVTRTRIERPAEYEVVMVESGGRPGSDPSFTRFGGGPCARSWRSLSFAQTKKGGRGRWL